MSIGRISTPNVLFKSNYHSLDILLSGLCSTFYDNETDLSGQGLRYFHQGAKLGFFFTGPGGSGP